MSGLRSPSDDNVDLFELFETFWVGKWYIIASAVVAILIVFGYHSIVQPMYKVSISYTANIYPVMAHQACRKSISCLESETTKRVIAAYGDNWQHHSIKPMISTRTANPLDVGEYREQFERFNREFTTKIHAEAVAELAMIKNEFGNVLLNSELVVANMLNATRVVMVVDGGLSALALTSLAVKETGKINVFFSVFAGALFGGVIGLILVTVLTAIRKRREQFSGV